MAPPLLTLGYRAGSLGSPRKMFSRGQIMGQGVAGITLSPFFLDAIENQILVAESSRKKLPLAMNDLCRTLALIQMGYAQKRSAGPVDPQQRMPEAAWKMPVRRITGRYFFGWKMRYVKLGIWQMYNDSREAYYIEFGIHRNPATEEVATRRQRRPILKLSLLDTLKFAQRSKVYDRIWANVFFPPPALRRGRGFSWQMQSPGVWNDTPVLERLTAGPASEAGT